MEISLPSLDPSPAGGYVASIYAWPSSTLVRGPGARGALTIDAAAVMATPSMTISIYNDQW